MHLRSAVLRCAVVVPSGLHQLAVDPGSRLLPQDALNPFRFSSTEASHGQANGNGSHLASGRDGVSQQLCTRGAAIRTPLADDVDEHECTADNCQAAAGLQSWMGCQHLVCRAYQYS